MPVGGVKHRLDIEELIGHLGDKELADDYHAHYGPEAPAHRQPEHALAGVEAAGIEHIPEVGPHKYREQQGSLVGCHGRLAAHPGMQHLWQRVYVGMVKQPVEAQCDGKEQQTHAQEFAHHGARQY